MPVFADYDSDRIRVVAQTVFDLFEEEDGLDALFGLVRPGGLLIYETFMIGNERLGKPSNPEFLLRPGELLTCLPPGWSLVAFEQGEVATPRPAVIQRLCATRTGMCCR